MNNKYDITISNTVINANKKRLINQLWKLIPMNENKEDWNTQLKTVINELTGLDNILIDVNFLILLSKLEGLFMVDDFAIFRKTVFESISLLDEILHD